MSFRRRTVLLAAAAVSAAIVIASVVVYFVTRGELIGQVDDSLRALVTPGLPQSVKIRGPAVGDALQGPAGFAVGDVPSGASRTAAVPVPKTAPHEALSVSRTRRVGKRGEIVTIERETVEVPPGKSLGAGGRNVAHATPSKGVGLILPAQRIGGPIGYVQLFQPNGKVLHSAAPRSELPVTSAALAVAAGRRDAFYSTVTLGGTRARTLTAPAPGGGVWQVAVPLAQTESTLARLRLVLALVCLGGIALAATFGLLVSRAALRPLRRLTGAAERVTRTQDLGHRIEAGEHDELGRLASSFNTMLAALERARLAQRRLISDASHELRTPLTSVQANLDALAVGDRLAPAERARVVAAAQAQLRELTVLVGDLTDLSRTEVEQIELEDVRLDLAAESAVARARLHAPGCGFALDTEPCLVRASPARLDRAIANLLDNACKWDPGGQVEVTVRRGRLDVRDHGPGIAAEDLPRVFDRFYRSAAARGRPGSGLGLAIVRQVAESHGGAVHAANDPDGGARLTIELPPIAMTAAELEGCEAIAAGRPLHDPPRSL
ncbi:MAG TPA: HAMP domain-containing sensor histidine kinase [Solirubrobacteraceae bacterium]|nr:HAMP domain-containing sensor histidine kinase [Solirubrobacteraceae bacterium]